MLHSLSFVPTLEENLTGMESDSKSPASDTGWSVIARLSEVSL